MLHRVLIIVGKRLTSQQNIPAKSTKSRRVTPKSLNISAKHKEVGEMSNRSLHIAPKASQSWGEMAKSAKHYGEVTVAEGRSHRASKGLSKSARQARVRDTSHRTFCILSKHLELRIDRQDINDLTPTETFFLLCIAITSRYREDLLQSTPRHSKILHSLVSLRQLKAYANKDPLCSIGETEGHSLRPLKFGKTLYRKPRLLPIRFHPPSIGVTKRSSPRCHPENQKSRRRER